MRGCYGRGRPSHAATVLAAGLALLLTLTSAWAIQPGQWTHTTEADFNPGEMKNVVVTNLGDLKLSANVALLDKMPDPATVIFDIAQGRGDAVYLAVGPEGRLLRRSGDAVEEVLQLNGEQAFALDHYEGQLLLAISGEPSRLAVLREGSLETLIELPTVRYIWDVIVDGKVIYLATGIEGQLLRVDLAIPAPQVEAEPAAPAEETDNGEPGADEADEADEAAEEAEEPAWSDPRVTVLLDAAQPNLLCLGRDSRGRIFVGTDGEGLVYRVTPAANGEDEAEVFVVYDAPEPEIAALLVLADGTVYAGTADAEQARPGRLEEARRVEAGRPELQTVPVVAEEPESPLPPDPDLPPPPQPDPMPQAPVEEEAAQDAGEAANGEDAVPVLPELPGGQRLQVDPAPQPEAEQQPTPQQLDALRQIIRDRLEQARQTGEMQMMPTQPRTARRPVAGAVAPPRPSAPQAPRKPGNAVYRIGSDLFVREIFRETVMILRIVEHDGKLLVATGNEGQVFQVNPTAEETIILADLEAQQVPAVLRGRDGRLLLGTANPAELHRLDSGFAPEGTYTSVTLDASHVSQWGRMHLTGQVDPQTSVRVETRSGNVQDPEQAPWSKWSEGVVLEHDATLPALLPREVAVTSPPARFLQYRLTLIGAGAATPVVDRVLLNYVMPNLKPVISSLQAQYADEAAGAPRPATPTAPGRPVDEPSRDPKLNVTWKAEDPNGDQLIYTLEYRAAGTEMWLPLAKNLTVTTFAWQTQRVPDGRYFLRVTASDAPDNPGAMASTATRQSDPILIDNTPPQFVGEPVVVAQDGRLTVRFTTRDDLSLLRSVHYMVDGDDQWQPALPVDMIFDSTSEDFVITIPDLAPGPHTITLRVIDARGNARYHAQVVEAQ